MVDIIFNGPEGKLEGKYTPAKDPMAPLAIVLHQHPKLGGNMDSKAVFAMFRAFVDMGFAAVRFNFSGVGRSQGVFDEVNELSSAAAAFDWLQEFNKEAKFCWVAGHGYGAWVGLQLLMRRPEIQGFVVTAPPAGIKDFTFLAPCPTSGMFIQGDADAVVAETAVRTLAERLSMQRGVKVTYRPIPGADHEFEGKLRDIYDATTEYVRDAVQRKSKKIAKGKK